MELREKRKSLISEVEQLISGLEVTEEQKLMAEKLMTDIEKLNLQIKKEDENMKNEDRAVTKENMPDIIGGSSLVEIKSVVHDTILDKVTLLDKNTKSLATVEKTTSAKVVGEMENSPTMEIKASDVEFNSTRITLATDIDQKLINDSDIKIIAEELLKQAVEEKFGQELVQGNDTIEGLNGAESTVLTGLTEENIEALELEDFNIIKGSDLVYIANETVLKELGKIKNGLGLSIVEKIIEIDGSVNLYLNGKRILVVNSNVNKLFLVNLKAVQTVVKDYSVKETTNCTINALKGIKTLICDLYISTKISDSRKVKSIAL